MKIRSLLLFCVLVAPGAVRAGSPLIVDWGHDWGAGWYRETTAQAGQPAQRIAEIDINNNGRTDDDYTGGWPFSMDKPLSPTTLVYDYSLPSATFYGGAVVQVTDVPNGEDGKPLRPRGATEGHINQNHELRDDWNLMAMPSSKREPEKERFAGALLVLWKKDDFLNGGAAHRVSFEPGDMIGVFISRYWGGIDWGRWVVKSAGKFYVSRATFGDQTKAFDLTGGEGTPNGAINPVVRKTHYLDPTQTEWAPYDPRSGYEIFFSADDAKFSKVVLDNVEAVGFLAQRNLSTGHPVADGLWKLPNGLGEAIALKFNAVQARATVHDLGAASSLVDMVPLGASASSPMLWVAKTETSYAQWLKVWRWAVTNQRAGNFPAEHKDKEIPGYSFVKDGAMGSMELAADHARTPDEPVTGITWHDAVLWCNALSESEGLVPAYYADAAFTQPLRSGMDRAHLEKSGERPAVYWRKDAAGYRLPTISEWTWAAQAGGNTAEPQGGGAANGTSPVASQPLNAWGLAGMSSNVAEYVWDARGDSFDPATEKVHAVLGASFAKAEKSLMPFGSEPARGAYDIGFRVVRNGSGVVPATMVGGPQRQVADGVVLLAESPMSVQDLQAMARKTLHLIDVSGSLPDNNNPNKDYRGGEAYPAALSGTEIPYRLWILVRNWAEQEKGYRFNFSGDMGSMTFPLSPNPAYTPDEPVTNVGWQDAAVWSNALSELLGLAPVYVDEATGQPVRQASPFRVAMYPEYHYPNTGNYAGRPVDTAAVMKWKAVATNNGFRLPTIAELEAAEQPQKSEEAGWFSTNSGMKTHPVGTRQPGNTGLYDMQGNVSEWTYGGDSLFGQVRFGNNFAYPPGVSPHRMNSKEHPGVGRSWVGFRVIRRGSTASES